MTAPKPSGRWVARIVTTQPDDVDRLLSLSLGLDVWERHDDDLVVAADAGQLDEVERRLGVTVERLGTVDEYIENKGER